jgi:TolB-like protein
MSEDEDRSTIFLSYAHADKAKAQRIAAALQKSGYTVWWDQLIEGGSRYAHSIDDALEKADAVVVAWSKSSIDSDWVKDEASHARERHKLVPVSLDGSAPPLGFRQYQMIDLSHWRGRPDAKEMEAVKRAIASALGQQPGPQRAQSISMDRRKAMIAGGAAASAAAGGALAWQFGLFGGRPVSTRSIAVLPFKNLSGDPSQSFLSDGLTEEIRSTLARNASLMVLAGTTSAAASKDGGNAKSISRELGVGYLLDGSVQRAGDRVRVATNLTNGKTGFSEWSQSVDRKLDDIFAFQSDIASSVASALSVRMATDAPTLGGTRNAKAYEAYLRGKALYNLAKDEASDREARANFEVAVATDPGFALAHAALSRVLSSIAASHATANELKPLYSAAVREAERAIDLAPRLAEGHLALGYAKFAGFLDVRGAKPSYDAAYEYGRGDADIVLLCAIYMVRARRFAQARDAIERALALDPLNPRTWRAAGTIALASGQPRQAVERYDKALSLNPSMSNAHAMKGYALIGLKEWSEAKTSLDEEPSAMFRLAGLAILGDKTSDKALAERSLDELVATEGDAALYQQAQVLAQWGRAGEATDRLERARAVGDPGLVALVTDPFLAPLANEPRYRELVRASGFE